MPDSPKHCPVNCLVKKQYSEERLTRNMNLFQGQTINDGDANFVEGSMLNGHSVRTRDTDIARKRASWDCNYNVL